MNQGANTPEIITLRHADPVGFLDKVYGMIDQPDTAAVGVKTIYNHFEYDAKHKEILSYLMAEKRRKKGKYMCSYNKNDHETEMRLHADPRAAWSSSTPPQNVNGSLKRCSPKRSTRTFITRTWPAGPDWKSNVSCAFWMNPTRQ